MQDENAVSQSDSMNRTLRDLADKLRSRGVHDAASWFTDAQIDTMYNAGHNLYQQSKYEKALQIFSALYSFRPKDERLVLAMAISNKVLKRHAVALALFREIEATTPEKTKVALHIAECLMHCDQKEEASAVLESLLAMPESSEADKLAKSKARHWIALMAGGQ